MNNIIIFCITAFCLIFFYEGELSHFSERVYLSSQLIMFFSTVMIFSDQDRAYSIKKMFYLFSFFFFGIAPLTQFYHQSSLFNARLLTEYEYFHLNILILFIFIFYEFFYRLFTKKLKFKTFSNISKLDIGNCSYKQTFLLILISLISFFSVLYLNGFNINRLLFRGGEFSGEIDSGMSSSFSLIFTQTLRPLAIICFLYYSLSRNRNIFIALFLFFIAILTVFPTGVPRFYAAAVYIPVMIILFKIFERKNFFSISFILGLLVIFPFLNNFRHYSQSTELELKFDFEMFTDGHFDSYQNFALIYFENMITWGRQLVGVIFFWVPRSIWPDKPIGSGFVLADKMNFSWDNVSANYFAEGYINFGYFGIFLFIILLAYLSSLLDGLYWREVYYRKHNFYKIVYLVLLGMVFFIMRGDLLSSTAFTVGFLMSNFIIYKFVHKKSYAFNN